MSDTYTVVVKQEADGRYVAVAPALRDCGSFGDTLPEALQMAEEAISLYLEGLREHGWEVPPDNPFVTVDMSDGREAFVIALKIREAAQAA
jgi:predicted RNase H-like HicB family nuclease